MPLYEYECGKCEERLEILQRITDDALEVCPKDQCKGDLKKLISKTSFSLKGGGWYADGYSSSSSGTGSGGD